jgi:hypothetical protein
MSIEVPTKYRLSQDRIVVFEIRLHSKSPMLYRPALHGNWNALSLARREFNDKFPMSTVSLTTVLQNRQVFLPDPIFADDPTYVTRLMARRLVAGCCSSHRFLLVFSITAIETLNTLSTCRTDHRYVWGLFAVKDIRLRFYISQFPYFDVCKWRGRQYLVAKGNVHIVSTKPYGVWLLCLLSFLVGFWSKRFRITLCNTGRGFWGILAVFFCFSASLRGSHVVKKPKSEVLSSTWHFLQPFIFPWVTWKKNDKIPLFWLFRTKLTCMAAKWQLKSPKESYPHPPHCNWLFKTQQSSNIVRNGAGVVVEL